MSTFDTFFADKTYIHLLPCQYDFEYITLTCMGVFLHCYCYFNLKSILQCMWKLTVVAK